MKRDGILNPGIMTAISSVGHTDIICIADAGLPIAEECNRIDISLVKNIPTFMDTLRAVKNEMVVESIVLAEEIKQASPELLEKIKQSLSGINIEYVAHEEFKRQLILTKAVIRTGECTPYANILLKSGVIKLQFGSKC